MIKNVLLGILLCVCSISGVKYHQDSRGAEIHTPFRWIVADSTAKAALSLSATDTGKFCFQLSDTSIWCLIDNSPLKWAFISGKKTDSLYLRTFQAVTAGITRANIDTSHTRHATADSATIPVFKGAKTIRDTTTFTGGAYFAGIAQFAGTLHAPVVNIDSMVGDVAIGGKLSILTGGGSVGLKVNGGANTGVNIAEFGAGSSRNKIVVINDNGYLGVKDSTPEYPLDVTGDGRFTGTLTTSTGITIAGGSQLTNFSKGTFVCSLYVNNNTDFVGHGTVQYQVVDSLVTLRFPYISGTITTSGVSGVNVRNVPTALRSGKSEQDVPASIYENGGYNIGLFKATNGLLYFYFITSSTGTPATGTFSLNRCVVQYFL